MKAKTNIAITLSIFLILFAVSAWGYVVIPDNTPIAIHWDIDGNTNGYAPKFPALFILPVILSVVALAMWFKTNRDPLKENLSKSSGAVFLLFQGVLIFMLVIQTAIISNALYKGVPVVTITYFGLGLVLLLNSYIMPKVSRNNSFGVRTSWTLKSDQVWQKTHKLASIICFLMGLGVLIGAVLNNSYVFIGVIIAGSLASILGTYPYSYYLYKKEKS
jgi:uncharacterized membrane protein